jgi:hypothetical protein
LFTEDSPGFEEEGVRKVSGMNSVKYLKRNVRSTEDEHDMVLKPSAVASSPDLAVPLSDKMMTDWSILGGKDVFQH